MEWFPKLLDLVFGVFQILACLFLVYGAWLAVRKTGGPRISGGTAPESAPQEESDFWDITEPPLTREPKPMRGAGKAGSREKSLPMKRRPAI